MPQSGETVGALVALPLRSSDDAELVEGIIREEPKAIAAMYDRYAALVRGLFVRTLGTSRDAEDLAQEAFLIVIKRASTLRDPSALRSFIVGIVIRVARNELRKRALRRWVGFEDAPDPPVDPYDAETAEQIRHLYAALDKLDSSLRLAFLARHVEGCDLAEAAEMCGCSIATYKRWLGKAEKRFEALTLADPVLKPMLERGRRES